MDRENGLPRGLRGHGLQAVQSAEDDFYASTGGDTYVVAGWPQTIAISEADAIGNESYVARMGDDFERKTRLL